MARFWNERLFPFLSDNFLRFYLVRLSLSIQFPFRLSFSAFSCCSSLMRYIWGYCGTVPFSMFIFLCLSFVPRFWISPRDWMLRSESVAQIEKVSFQGGATIWRCHRDLGKMRLTIQLRHTLKATVSVAFFIYGKTARKFYSNIVRITRGLFSSVNLSITSIDATRRQSLIWYCTLLWRTIYL